jgi:hypothetical protein
VRDGVEDAVVFPLCMKGAVIVLFSLFISMKGVVIICVNENGSDSHA